jgi:aryl-alcohol dehydrogenase-like predicted oxidoreductase
MQYRRLGSSGIEVSTLSLGTMMFGRWGNPDEESCRRMVDAALAAGVTLFDTADIYDFGVSEEFLGRAIAGRRDSVVLATKVGNAMSEDPLERGLSRRWVLQSCDASLRRLGTDYIDLYQMHRPDPSTPIDETLQAFDELVQAGKVRATGTSTFSRAQLAEARATAETRGIGAPASEQPPYSVLVRAVETEVLPWCRQHDVGVLVWAPLNGGWLTGKYQSASVDGGSRAAREPDHFDHRDEVIRSRKRELVDRLAAVAASADLTLIQLAIGFVLAHPAVTSALIGPRTPEQMDSLLAAADVVVPHEVLAAVDAIVPPGLTVNPVDNGNPVDDG